MRTEFSVFLIIGIVATTGLVLLVQDGSTAAVSVDEYIAPAMKMSGSVRDLQGRFACNRPMRAISEQGFIAGEGQIPPEDKYSLVLRRGWNQLDSIVIEVGTHEQPDKGWQYCTTLNTEDLVWRLQYKRQGPIMKDIVCEKEYLRCQRWRKDIVRTPY